MPLPFNIWHDRRDHRLSPSDGVRRRDEVTVLLICCRSEPILLKNWLETIGRICEDHAAYSMLADDAMPIAADNS